MPKFSIITPVYNPPADVLRDTIESVLRQSIGDWELWLIDDASTAPHVWPLLEEYAGRDDRIFVAHRDGNGGISRASNDALARATGEFVRVLDHDDLLMKDSLAIVNHQLVHHRGAVDFCYTDEAKLMPDGTIGSPFYKPDWSPERMRSHMYTGHLSVMRRTLVEEVGGFRPEFRRLAGLRPRAARHGAYRPHPPRRRDALPLAGDPRLGRGNRRCQARGVSRRGSSAVQEHCVRVGIDAAVEMTEARGHHRVRRRLRGEPLVSIVIPTRGSDGVVQGEHRVHVLRAVESIFERSTYTNLEFVVVR